jgi:hypothetical protein
MGELFQYAGDGKVYGTVKQKRVIPALKNGITRFCSKSKGLLLGFETENNIEVAQVL